MSILPFVQSDDPIREFLDRTFDGTRFESEADAVFHRAPERAALALFAAAHAHERQGAKERAVVEYLVRAIGIDPACRPASWGLRAIARRRREWDNLARTLEAEARLGRFAWPRDQADVLVELAWLAALRQGSASAAVSLCEQALDVDPSSLAAALSLIALARQSAGVTVSPARIVQAVEVLAARALPASRSAWRAALGWCLPVDDLNAVEDAITYLSSAWRVATTAEDQTVLVEAMDLLSLRASKGKGAGALRMRVLDLWDEMLSSRSTGTTRVPWLLVLREKASLLLQNKQSEAAAAVLKRAWAAMPGHPLLYGELGDVAAHAGIPESPLAFAVAHQNSPDGPAVAANGASFVRAEAAIARADRALRASAVGEALMALAEVEPNSGLTHLASLFRICAAARLSDARPLAESLVYEAERLLYEEDARVEAAHVLVRAGAVFELALADTTTAEVLYRRAWALSPGYRPAIEGLVTVLTGGGRWDDLVEVLNQELATLDEPERKRALRETIFLIDRDVLGDPGGAAAMAMALVGDVPDVRALYRVLEATAGAARDDREAVAALSNAVDALIAQVRSEGLKTALALLAARLCRRLGQLDGELRFALQAAARDSSAAASWLERTALCQAAERRAALNQERTALERLGADDRARALRFRLAFQAARQGDLLGALRELDPLRAKGDRVAAVWMLDLAEREGSLPALRLACAAGANTQASDPLAAQRFRLLAEGLERQKKVREALAAYAQASVSAGDVSERLDAELGRARVLMDASNGGPGARLAEVLDGMAGMVAGAAGAALNDDARVCRLLARQPEDAVVRGASVGLSSSIPVVLETSGETGRTINREDPGLALLHWGRRRPESGRERIRARLQLLRAFFAAASSPGENSVALAAPWLSWRLDLVGWLADEGVSDTEALDKKDADSASSVCPSTVVATDVRKAEPEVLLARALRLSAGESLADAQLAYGLALEAGLLAEQEDKPATAVRAFRIALRIEPGSVAAYAGLARIARSSGNKWIQARMIAALAEHLELKVLANPLWAEAGELASEANDVPLALQCYGHVLRAEPEHVGARLAVRRLLRAQKDFLALEQFFSFELGLALEPDAQRFLYVQRAQVRADFLGARQGAVDDYRRALALDPACVPALVGLGDLALAVSDAGAAQRFFLRAIEVLDSRATSHDGAPTEHALPSPSRTAVLARLAQAHVVAGALDEAQRVLLTVLSESPGHRPARTRLVQLLEKEIEHKQDVSSVLAEFVARIEGSPTLAPSDRAMLFVGLARLAPTQDLAAQWFMRALEDDPLGDGLDAIEEWIACADGEPAERLRIGLARIEDELVARFDADTLGASLTREVTGSRGTDAPGGKVDEAPQVLLERIARLARLGGRFARARAASQLVSFIDAGLPTGRAPSLEARLDEETWLTLLDRSGHGNAEDAAVAAIARLLLRDGVAIAAAQENTPIAAQHLQRLQPGDARLGWVSELAQALGFAGPNAMLVVELAADAPLLLHAGCIPVPTLTLGAGVLSGDPVSRFRVARALARLRFGLVDTRPTAKWRASFIARLVLGGLSHPAWPVVERSVVKQVGRYLARRDRGLHPELMQTLTGVPDLGLDAAWAAIVRLADRIGAVVCGDLGVAVTCVAESAQLKLGDADSLARPNMSGARLLMFTYAPVRELIRFALGPGYARLHAALAPRITEPTEMTGRVFEAGTDDSGKDGDRG